MAGRSTSGALQCTPHDDNAGSIAALQGNLDHDGVAARRLAYGRLPTEVLSTSVIDRGVNDTGVPFRAPSSSMQRIRGHYGT